MAQRLTERAVPLEEFMARVAESRPARVPGTAVFMTAQPRGTPPALAHNLRYNKVLHEHVVTLMVTTQPVPHVSADEQISVRPLGQGLFDVVVRYGFMEIQMSRRRSREPGNAGLNWMTRTSRFSWAGRPSSLLGHPEWQFGGSGCSC